MGIVKPRSGASFGIEVKHNFGQNSVDMLDYLNGLDEKLRKKVVRKMVAAAGSQLAKEIRRQIGKRDMPYSRGRNAAERRKSRQAGVKPLVRTIKTKVWSKARKGIIGAIVGPGFPAGAHGHLVEFGHRIVPRKSSKRSLRKRVKQLVSTTKRAKAHEFQQEAMLRSQWAMYQGMAKAMGKALAKENNPHVKQAIIAAQRAAGAPF